MLLGSDISRYQGDADLVKMKAAGVNYVIFKATESNFHVDAWLGRNIMKALAADIPWGVYHYIRNVDVISQINHIKATTKDFPMPPMGLMSDLEVKTSAAWWATWLSKVEAEFAHLMLMTYSNQNWWGQNGNPPMPSNRHQLNVASYRYHEDKWWQLDNHLSTMDVIRRTHRPSMPKNWTRWDFWQFTDKAPGSYYGVQSKTVDLDFFNGTQADFDALYKPKKSGSVDWSILLGKVAELEESLNEANQESIDASVAITYAKHSIGSASEELAQLKTIIQAEEAKG